MKDNRIILEISKIKSLINYKFGDVINEQKPNTNTNTNTNITGIPTLDFINSGMYNNQQNNQQPANQQPANQQPASQQTYNKPQGYVNNQDTDINVLTSGQKIIGRGARGPIVKQVQALLVKHYPDKKALIGCSGDTCDGIWGKNSIAYATDFQTKRNIPGYKNGVVGKNTYAELLK